MYRIREERIKLQVPCKTCWNAGILIENCYTCNGKGWHYKHFPYWRIAKKTTTVERIDREHHDGPYRFWTSKSEYFPESSKILHFTVDDAQHECNIRNRDIDNLIRRRNRDIHHVNKR